MELFQKKNWVLECPVHLSPAWSTSKAVGHDAGVVYCDKAVGSRAMPIQFRGPVSVYVSFMTLPLIECVKLTPASLDTRWARVHKIMTMCCSRPYISASFYRRRKVLDSRDVVLVAASARSIAHRLAMLMVDAIVHHDVEGYRQQSPEIVRVRRRKTSRSIVRARAFPGFFTRVEVARVFSANGNVPSLLERVKDVLEVDVLEHFDATLTKLNQCCKHGMGHHSAIERIGLAWHEMLLSPSHLHLDGPVSKRWGGNFPSQLFLRISACCCNIVKAKKRYFSLPGIPSMVGATNFHEET